MRRELTRLLVEPVCRLKKITFIFERAQRANRQTQ